ncbi:MAG: Guanylate kinase [Pelotomaculum sp. PtaB.Bin104]|nr:MAG: Guanylate kinase [Pelotomaculum sp. PtaB.Bin104]
MDQSAALHKGILFVVSGPSGTGKGTICKALLDGDPALRLSISTTTRSPRIGEVEGEHYFFLTKEIFSQMIREGQFLEWAEVYGNYYGTSRQFVLETLEQGSDVILEIDIQGALQVKEKFPEAVLIFVSPPSMSELKERLIVRGTDSLAEIEKRLSYTADELKLAGRYDYVVINDNLAKAVEKVRAIITAEKSRPWHFKAFFAQFGQ